MFNLVDLRDNIPQFILICVELSLMYWASLRTCTWHQLKFIKFEFHSVFPWLHSVFHIFMDFFLYVITIYFSSFFSLVRLPEMKSKYYKPARNYQISYIAYSLCIFLEKKTFVFLFKKKIGKKSFVAQFKDPFFWFKSSDKTIFCQKA